jgi:hypothetical protein
MIIRILGEGQFRFDDSHLGDLNKIDNQIVDHVKNGDQDGFCQDLVKMISMVKELGNAVTESEIIPSDIIVPPADLSFKEARNIFCNDGLIEG